MTAFLLQLWTILQEGYVQIYLLFFVLVNAFWWTRVYIASKNKDYTADFTGSCAVIIPVFREEPAVFEQCLRSIREHGKPKQIIVTVDNAPAADKRVKKLARKYADVVLYMPEQVGKREQYYQASRRLANVDIVLTVDSDTYWDTSTRNILRPFTNQVVGAASGCQTIFDHQRTWVRRAAEWMEDMRFRVTLSFQSYYGQVNVIPGRTLAIRAHLFREIAVETRDERVLGRRVITSDDASITMGVLARGYTSVYQSNSLVHTDAPDTYMRFWRQYLRWYRGSVRRLLYKFPVLIRQHPLVFLSNVEFNFGTFLYAAILSSFLFKLHFRLYEILPMSGFAVTESFNWRFVSILVLGFFVSSYIRNIPHLLHHPRDALFLPVFAVFTFVTMLPLKIVSLFSFFENGWMTRRQNNSSVREEHVGRTRVVAACTGVLIMMATMPLPYLIDINHLRIPMATIVRGEAPEYYKAREMIASYQAGNAPVSDASISHLIEKHSRQQSMLLNYSTLQNAVDCASYELQINAPSLDINQPLAPFNGCINQPDKYASARTPQTATPQTLGVMSLVVQPGDSQTKLVRKAVAVLDSDHMLTHAQVAFIESTVVATMGAQDMLLPGQTIDINLDRLQTVIQQSHHLTPTQVSAWQAYGAHIAYGP